MPHYLSNWKYLKSFIYIYNNNSKASEKDIYIYPCPCLCPCCVSKQNLKSPSLVHCTNEIAHLSLVPLSPILTRESRYLLLLYWLCQNLWLCGPQHIFMCCGKILKGMGIPDHLTCSWEIYMQVRKQCLELDGTTDWFQIGKGAR